jgi:hypothetical protein
MKKNGGRKSRDTIPLNPNINALFSHSRQWLTVYLSLKKEQKSDFLYRLNVP